MWTEALTSPVAEGIAMTSISKREELTAALEQFNEERGGVPVTLREYLQELRRARKRIVEALKTGPLTVPEIAEHAGLSKDVVLWHIAAMRKYGQVREVNSNGSDVRYALVG
jgi:predicted Rossmann fold nucleotide-binding protein DprA/Smf involved in DNA uptake